MAPRAHKTARPKTRRPGGAAAGDTRGGSRPDRSAVTGGHAERSTFRLSLAGLLTTMALASLDQNIVSTALPRIVGELGGLAHLPWVITAFMLTATATAPLYGKLSDMHGRRPLFVVAIVVFIAGSALCGLARSMTGLICSADCRALAPAA